MASTSPTGARKPVTPSSTTSGTPPARAATTGTSQLMASSAARPKLSLLLGSRNRSLIPRMVCTSGNDPRNCVRPITPRSRARSKARDRSGPSPTISKRAGISLDTRAKTSTTSCTRLTGRKLLTCTISASSGCAKRARTPASVMRVKRSLSTKL